MRDGQGRRRSGRSKRKESCRKITEKEVQEYIAKKAQKKALKVAKKLKSQAVSGYSNESNPFGDSNLTEKFVWRKKIERDVVQGLPLDMLSVKNEKKRQKERMAEIEKVKKRRTERAIEKAQHEEEMAILARERARAEFQDWEKKEEEFHFEQSKVRSEIRLREGRTKPIDILSKNLNGSEDFDIEINEPYMVFKGLTVKEMEELRDDIRMHLDLDRATPTHIQFWEIRLGGTLVSLQSYSDASIIFISVARGYNCWFIPPSDVHQVESHHHMGQMSNIIWEQVPAL